MPVAPGHGRERHFQGVCKQATDVGVVVAL